jgi:hypothetical protein
MTKAVFLIVYRGGTTEIVKKKLKRVCESYEAVTFNIPGKYSTY